MEKKIILSFILGAIISSVVGVIAANTISSSSVIYKDDKTVNTVLDELFENVDAIESDDTRLTSLEGKVNTLTSIHSSDIANISNTLSQHNTSINTLYNNVGYTMSTYMQMGVSGKTNVTGTVIVQKLNATTANIHINYRVNENLGSTDTDVLFINLTTIKNSFGLSKIEFQPWQTRVTIDNAPDLDYSTYFGYSSLLAQPYGNYEYLLFCREYLSTGTYGGWAITQPIYDAGTYGHIDIYGATIS